MPTAEAPAVRRPAGPRAVARRFRGSAAAMVGSGLTALVVVTAVGAHRIASGNPFATSPTERLQPPSARHLLGTDQLGRDLFTNVVQGAHTSMRIVAGVVAIASVVGVLLGCLSGFRGGILDDLVMRVVETVQSVPRFFVAVLVIGWFGAGAVTVTVLLGLTSWPVMARVVRAETLSLRERDFIGAARSTGASDTRIVLRHIVPNVVPSALVMAAVTGSRVVLLEAGLAYLGLGDPNVASWGALINNAQPYLDRAWWLSVFPGTAMAAAVLGMNLLSDGLTDVFGASRRLGPTSDR